MAIITRLTASSLAAAVATKAVDLYFDRPYLPEICTIMHQDGVECYMVMRPAEAGFNDRPIMPPRKIPKPIKIPKNKPKDMA